MTAQFQLEHECDLVMAAETDYIRLSDLSEIDAIEPIN